MNKYTIEDELRQVERLREQYPSGTKIQCIQMDDPYHAQLIMSMMPARSTCLGRMDQALD